MSLAVVYSRALSGMDAPLVTVEVHLGNGLPSFTMLDCWRPISRDSRNAQGLQLRPVLHP